MVPYSPLARGVLTGKYRDGTPPGSRAARGDKRLLETDFQPESIAAANAAGRVVITATQTERSRMMT